MKYIKEIKSQDFEKALSLDKEQVSRLKNAIQKAYDQNWSQKGANVDQINAFVVPYIKSQEEAFYAGVVITTVFWGIANIVEQKITYKSIQALFKAMQENGIKQIFISKERNPEVFESINKWFSSRNKSVPSDKYVWMKGSLWETSFVKDGNDDNFESQLHITFTDDI